MAMRAASAPRRVYVRKGSLLIMQGGVYYGPDSEATEINHEKEVRLERVERPWGEPRQLQVSQRKGNAWIREVWSEKTVVFTPRAKKASLASEPEAIEEAPSAE